MIREYIHDSCCPICNRAETTERVIREEEGCTKVSRVCTACGGEWRSSLDNGVIQNMRIKKLEAENERLRVALISIARNTCCDRCQEAALMARNALEGKP